MVKPATADLEAQLRQLEAAQHRRADEKLDPTDCALSTWAEGHAMRLLRTQLSLAWQEWMAWFPHLEDQRGCHVPAKLIVGRYGLVWSLMDSAGRFMGKFISAKPGSYRSHGVRVGWTLSPAHAALASPRGATGPANNIWVEVRRDSDEMSFGRLTVPEDDQDVKSS